MIEGKQNMDEFHVVENEDLSKSCTTSEKNGPTYTNVRGKTTFDVDITCKSDGAQTRESKHKSGIIDGEKTQNTNEWHDTKCFHHAEEKTDTKRRPRKRWFILIAAFVSNGFGLGFCFNMSVLYIEWLEAFGKSSSETALVQSVCTGMFMIAGCIIGVAVTKFGPRKCGIIGGLLASFGLGISFLATSLIYLTVSIGVLGGIGNSICNVCAYTSVSQYFGGKQKFIAFAIVATGSGIGFAVVPIITEILIKVYSWRGTLLIFGGVALHLVVSGCLFDSTVTKRSNGTPPAITIATNESIEKTDFFKNSSDTKVDDQHQGLTTKQSSSKFKTFLRNISSRLTNLFENKEVFLYIFGHALAMAAFQPVFIFYIDFMQYKGISRTDAVTIYTYGNIVSAASRLVPGVFKQLPHISVLSIPTCCSFLCAVTVGCFPLTNSYTESCLVVCIYGLGVGCILGVRGMAVDKLVSREKYPALLGLSMTLTGVLNLSSGPLSGYIKDLTGNYDISYYCAAFVLMVTCTMFAVSMGIRYYKKQKTDSYIFY